jgi:hypothetical protein
VREELQAVTRGGKTQAVVSMLTGHFAAAIF